MHCFETFPHCHRRFSDPGDCVNELAVCDDKLDEDRDWKRVQGLGSRSQGGDGHQHKV